MEYESLAVALEHEHHEIDDGIARFAAAPPADRDRAALTRAVHALRRHIYLEEEFLFPPLREAGPMAPVLVMLREHGQMWATLDELEHELAVGAHDGPALALCHRLTVQLQHHNLKEERILYPEADAALTAPASAHLREFLDAGALPDGWTCRQAGVTASSRVRHHV